jgi:hypothetical protein
MLLRMNSVPPHCPQFEITEADEISAKFLGEELYPKAAEKQGFSKPSRPGTCVGGGCGFHLDDDTTCCRLLNDYYVGGCVGVGCFRTWTCTHDGRGWQCRSGGG